MDALRGLAFVALGLGAIAGGAWLLGTGALGEGPSAERPRSMMGSGFVNDHADAGPGTWYWSDWLDLRLDAPEETAVVIWNHGTVAQTGRVSCMGTGYFPPPAIIRLERIAGVRVYYLCTEAAQAEGARAYFEARRDEILDLAARFRALGLAEGRLFLAGQSGGATAAALALAAEPESFGGGILIAPAWEGRGEGLRRILRRGSAHDAWIRETLSAAEGLRALVLAYENDEWNGPEDLAFLAREGVEIVSPGCGAGHGGAYEGCGVEPSAEAAARWLRARLAPGG